MIRFLNNDFKYNFHNVHFKTKEFNDGEHCPICEISKPKETYIITGFDVKTKQPIQWKMGRTILQKIIDISKPKYSKSQKFINKILKIFGLKQERYFKLIHDKNTYQFNFEEIKNANI